MKLLARWGLILGLMGGAFVGPAMMGTMSAQAIPQDQIVQKLQLVPVFTIGSSQGQLLTASVPSNENGGANVSVSRIFINQQDAKAFLEQVKEKNPELGQTMQVIPMPLSEVYRLYESHKDKPERLVFSFVPMQQQVDSAITLLKQQGQNVDAQQVGVPLFVARGGGTDQGYLTIEQGDKQAVLMFFNKEDLQSWLDQVKQQDPNIASSVKIEVASLESVMEALISDNEPFLTKIELVPPPESRQLLQQEIQRRRQQAQPGSQPGTQPPAPASPQR